MSLRGAFRFLLHLRPGTCAFLALAWFAVIHVPSLVPKVSSIPRDTGAGPVVTNWIHFPMYAGFAVLVALTLRPELDRYPGEPHLLWRAWAICLLAGISDELHQYFVPWREADLVDLMTDVLAAGGALWIIRAISLGRSSNWLLGAFALTAAATLGTSMLAVYI